MPVAYGPCQTGTISSSRSLPCLLAWSGILHSVWMSALSLCSWILRDPETPSVPRGQRMGRGKVADYDAGDTKIALLCDPMFKLLVWFYLWLCVSSDTITIILYVLCWSNSSYLYHIIRVTSPKEVI